MSNTNNSRMQFCKSRRVQSLYQLLVNKSRNSIEIRSSEKERMVDALALDADEGRGKLRKATGSRKQTSIRRSPNVGTHQY